MAFTLDLQGIQDIAAVMLETPMKNAEEAYEKGKKDVKEEDLAKFRATKNAEAIKNGYMDLHYCRPFWGRHGYVKDIGIGALAFLAGVAALEGGKALYNYATTPVVPDGVGATELAGIPTEEQQQVASAFAETPAFESNLSKLRSI